jgi:aryl-alcohol dehydrogenase-like predicted oxidoreductase
VVPSTERHAAGRRTVGPFIVGPVAFGCWRFTGSDVAASTALLEAALDHGVNLVDTADVYGLDWGGTGFGACEAHLGEVLRATPSLRDRMVLATKGGISPPVPYDSSPTALTMACEASLRRLNVDHVDLYQIHRPDLFAHPVAVAATLQSLIDRGLVRSIGVSNHTAHQTAALQAHLSSPLVSVQPELHAAELSALRDGTLDYAMAHGLAVLAWSPLAGGRLATGQGIRPALLDTLDRIATAHGTNRSTIALAFVLAHPSQPVAIIGTQRPDRIVAAVESTSIELSRAEIYEIVVASDGVPLP